MEFFGKLKSKAVHVDPRISKARQFVRAPPGIGDTVNRLKIIGVTATLAVMLLGGQPAAAAPAEGRGVAPAVTQVSCKVTNRWTCVTPPLNTFSSTIFHYASTGIPNLAPSGQASSFVVVRDIAVSGWPEVNRQYRYGGAEHDHWANKVYSTYQAELHCPYTCQGAVLYFANG